jgi:hypothetical protein
MLHIGTCTLEDVARRCPNLTWNQVFLVVDHLSRTGRARLMPAKGVVISSRSCTGRTVGLTDAHSHLNHT